MEEFRDAFNTDNKIGVHDPVNGFVAITLIVGKTGETVALDRHTYQDFIRHLNKLTWLLHG